MQVNIICSCGLFTTEYNEQLLEAIITLARLTYPVLVMVHLQWFTCDELLAMTTRNNHLSLETLCNLENNSENRL